MIKPAKCGFFIAGKSMSTAYRDISAALDSALSTYVTANSIATAWENSGYTPVTGTLYIRPTNLQGDTAQAELGSTGKDETLGVYQIDIFAPLDEGKSEAVNMADDLADLYSRGSVHTYNSVNVRIRRVSRGSGNRDGAWWKVPVFIYYQSFTAAR